MTAASGIMLAPLAMSMKTFTAFDDNMRETQAVTQANAVEFDKLSAKAKELGKTTSFTAIQVTQAMATLGRAGFKAGQINDAIDSVLNLARATRTDLNEATRIASMTMRGFVLESTDMSHIADVLSVTSNSAALNLQDLGESMKYVAPVAAQAGLSLEDAAGAIAIFSNYGIRGSMAGTGLKNILARMASPEVRQKYEALGVSVVDASGKMRRFIDIMRDVGNATKDLGSGDKLGVFRELADLRALPSFAVAASNPEKIVEIVDNLEQSFGKAAKTAAMMDAGIGGSFRFLISALEGTRLALADSIQTPLKNYMDTLRDYINEFSAWVKYHGSVITTYAKTGVVLLALGGIIYGVGKATKVLAGGFTLARGAAKGFGGVVGLLANSLKEYSGVAALTQKADAAKAALTEKQRAFGVATQAASLASTRLADAQRNVNYMQRSGITSTVQYLRAVDQLNVAQTAHEAATRRVALAKEQLAKAQADATAATLAAQKNGGGNKAIFLGAYHRLGGPITNMSNLEAGDKVLGALAYRIMYVGKVAQQTGQQLTQVGRQAMTAFMNVTDKALGPLTFRLTYAGAIIREKLAGAFSALQLAYYRAVGSMYEVLASPVARMVSAAQSGAQAFTQAWGRAMQVVRVGWGALGKVFNGQTLASGLNRSIDALKAMSLKSVVDSIKGVGTAAKASVGDVNRLKTALSTLVANVQKNTVQIGKQLSLVGKQMTTAFMNVADQALGPLTFRLMYIGTIIREKLANALTPLQTTYYRALGSMYGALEGPLVRMASAAQSAAQAVVQTWGRALNAVRAGWSGLGGVFSGQVFGGGINKASLSLGALVARLSAVRQEAVRVGQQVATAFMNVADQALGPLTYRLMYIGTIIREKLVSAFTTLRIAYYRALGSMYGALESPLVRLGTAAQTAAQTFSQAWGRAMQNVRLGWSGFWKTLGSARSTYSDQAFANGLNNTISAIKNISLKVYNTTLGELASKLSAIGKQAMQVGRQIAAVGRQVVSVFMNLTDRALGPLTYRLMYVGTMIREKLTSAVTPVGTIIMDKLASAVSALQTAYERVGTSLYDVFASPVARLGSAAQSAAQIFTQAWTRAMQVVRTGWAGVTKVFNGQTLVNGLNKAIDALRTVSFKSVTTAIKGIGIAAKASAVGVNILKVALGTLSAFGGQIAGMVATMALLKGIFATANLDLTVDTSTKQAEEGDKLQARNKVLMDYMENLQKLSKAAEVEPLDHDAFEAAKHIIDTLNESVQGLGLTYDELNGSISVATDAQDKLNAALKQQTVQNLMDQMQAKQDELWALRDKRNRYEAAGVWEAFAFNEDAAMAWSKLFHRINPFGEDFDPVTGKGRWRDTEKIRASLAQEAQLQKEYDELFRQYNLKTKTDIQEGEDIDAAIERAIKRNQTYEPVAFKDNTPNVDDIVSNVMTSISTARSPAEKIEELRKKANADNNALQKEIDRIGRESAEFMLNDKQLGFLNNQALDEWADELGRQYREGTSESMRAFLERWRQNNQQYESVLTADFRSGRISEADFETTIQALHKLDSFLPQFERRFELLKAQENIDPALQNQIKEISDEQVKSMRAYVKGDVEDSRMAELNKAKQEYDKQIENVESVAKALQETGQTISFGDMTADGSSIEVLKDILKAIRDQTEAEINKKYDEQNSERVASAMRSAGASYMDVARVAYGEKITGVRKQADVSSFENAIAQADWLQATGQISEQARDSSVYESLLGERNALLGTGDLAYLGKKLEEARKSYDKATEEYKKEGSDENAKALEEAAGALNTISEQYEGVFNNLISPIDEALAELLNKTYEEQEAMRNAGDERARVEYGSRGTFSAYEGSAIGDSTLNIKIEKNTAQAARTLQDTLDWWKREYVPNDGAVFS